MQRFSTLLQKKPKEKKNRERAGPWKRTVQLTDGSDQPEFVFHGPDQPANLELVIRNVSLDG
jgi:hypothetical protein